jgi:hypothetical protein
MFRRAKAFFLRDLIAADRLVAERGGRFYHFLQPSVYVQKTHSEYERQVMENDRRLVDGLAEAYASGYPKLRAATIEARAAGVAAFDISDAFAARPPGTEVYFDGFHANEIANALAAERIYRIVFDAEPPDDETDLVPTPPDH